MEYNNGDRYIGDWDGDKKNGEGIFKNKDRCNGVCEQ